MLLLKGHLNEIEMRKIVRRDGALRGVALFRDLGTNKLFGGPGPLVRH